MSKTPVVSWQLAEVQSPHLDRPVSVVAAKNVPYVPKANRFQNLNIYLVETPETSKLVGQHVTRLPASTHNSRSNVPCWQVHIHGGAWRDPQLTCTSIEAAVAHAFSATDTAYPITAIASLNYTLSPFPTHPTLPYDPVKDDHSDPSREAKHPQHVHDVLSGFTLLRSLGLVDGSYILTGHSAGGCLSFQSILQSPRHWRFDDDDLEDAPTPAAIIGMNGLYDLPDLVHDLGASHAHLADVYHTLQGIAFGTDESLWSAASPARFDPDAIAERIRDGKVPSLVLLDQSTEDQLVPVNQANKLEAVLKGVPGLEVVRGRRCRGKHAAPWEEGYMIWDNVQDVLKLLDQGT